MNTLASLPSFTSTTSAGCGPVGQPGSAVMSSGFTFGGMPVKLTTPLIVPAVEAATLMVVALGAEAFCSEEGCDLPQPASAAKATSAVVKSTPARDAYVIFSMALKHKNLHGICAQDRNQVASCDRR